MNFLTKIHRLKSSFEGQFLEYVRHNRIPIYAETRKFGIIATLIGWALIALATVLFQDSSKYIPPAMNFFIQFLTATLILFIACLFNGRNFIKITLPNFTDSSKKNVLSLPWRKGLIYFRSIIAVVGYMAYSWARVRSVHVDNSALFSADALFYAGIFYWVFKEKLTSMQIRGILIAFLGVCVVFSFNFNSLHSIAIGGVGLFSSGCLALIILLIIVIVQQDQPLRIAFYQCAIGLLISVFWMFVSRDSVHVISEYPLKELLYSMFAGAAYACALLFFFHAYLYAESILISVLGYSLMPFVSFFSWITGSGHIYLVDIVSFCLIALGGGLVVYSEYKEGKNKKNVIGDATYQLSLVDKLKELRSQYKKGTLDQYDYMSKGHEFNKLLFAFSEGLSDTDIKAIEITKSGILFTVQPYDIEMETDGACRSAPMEMLNFGKYEPMELDMLTQLLQDGDVIIDMGAHIGFYSLVLAKNFPHSHIYAFEPIPDTYALLQKNIQRNSCKNIRSFNYGLSDKPKNAFFHYFRGGSALASQVNLIGHKTKKIKCQLAKLDDVVVELNITKIDAIKCDIEGGELAAVRGSLNVIKNFLPIIFIELYEEWCRKFNYSPNDVLIILEDIGYQCFSVSNGVLKKENSITNEGGNYNYFFLHSQKHKNLIEKHLQ